MRVKFDPSGCGEHKGLLRLLFRFYLEKGDYGYDKKKADTPFHNHFYYVDPDISDDEILDIGEAFLQEAYVRWMTGSLPAMFNPAIEFPVKRVLDFSLPQVTFNSSRIANRIQELKNKIFERAL